MHWGPGASTTYPSRVVTKNVILDAVTDRRLSPKYRAQARADASRRNVYNSCHVPRALRAFLLAAVVLGAAAGRVAADADSSGHGIATAMFLGCLLLAFFGLTRVVFGIVDGRPRPTTRRNAQRFVETAGVIVPPLVLLVLSLWLGLFTPAILREAWLGVVAQLFPTP